MKKLLALLLVGMMIFSLAACGDNNTTDPDKDNPGVSQSGENSNGGEKNNEVDYSKLANGIAESFGVYEGKNISWKVLTVDEENKKALLITDKCIDLIPFNTTDESFTWENSEIRTWLSGEFFENAFTDAEKTLIIETVNKNPANSQTGIRGCGDTTDRVFILSETEALDYFEENEHRLATSYEGDVFQWWLRTPGDSESWFMLINDEGGLYYAGSTSQSSYGVRPVIWIDLSTGENAE